MGIFVSHPARWFVVRSEEMPAVEKGRSVDRAGVADWDALACALELAAAQLLDVSPEMGTLMLPRAMGLQGDIETKILREWFDEGTAVTGSPASGGRIRDGRARVAAVWSARPDALIPIRSEALLGLEDYRWEPAKYSEPLWRAVDEEFDSLSLGMIDNAPHYAWLLNDIRKRLEPAGARQ